MNTYVPNYYKNFKCIADKCTHSCCVGWEIDIDKDTLCYYNSLDSEIGTMLRENISNDEDAHFILKEGDRCPFLKENGLCHLICELGEDSLCNICDDHPRFRNFYSGGVEIGLGMCCEAAADLILNFKEYFVLEGQGDIYTTDEEKVMANMRNRLIAQMNNKTDSIPQRFEKILRIADAELTEISPIWWAEFFLSLERLDESWTFVLEKFKITGTDKFSDIFDDPLPVSQLATYFLFRHVPEAIADGNLASKVKFAVLGTVFVHTLAVTLKDNYSCYRDALLDFARMFSSEIEYSSENLDAVMDELMW